MAAADKLAFLENEIKGRILGAKERLAHYREGAVMVAITTTALSAAVTVSVGVGEIYGHRGWSIAALLFSGLITVLNAWDALKMHRHLWIQNNNTLMQLYELDTDIRYLKAAMNGQISDVDNDTFYARYKAILAEANQGWEAIRARTIGGGTT